MAAEDDTFADLLTRWLGIEACLGVDSLSAPVLQKGGKIISHATWKKDKGASVGRELVDTPCGQLDLAAARHNVRRYWERWNPFRFAWLRGEKDLPALSSQVSNLRQAELEMQAAGAKIVDLPKAAPDIEDMYAVQTTINNAASAMGLPPSVLGPGAGALGVSLAALPLWVKVAAGGVVGLVVLSSLSNVAAIARVVK